MYVGVGVCVCVFHFILVHIHQVCSSINIMRFFLQNQKFTYFWQVGTLGQSTSSEMTCLIQLLMIATWWRPHGCWWHQKRIVNIWQKVGPLVSIHSVRCSLSNRNCFSDMPWPWIALLTKNFGILPVDNMVVLHCIVRDSWSRRSSLVRFSLFGSSLKSWSLITTKLGSKMK